MEKKKTRTKISRQKVFDWTKKILVVIMVLSMIISLFLPIVAHADGANMLTLGADLTPEQKELILNYLNVRENEVEVITITNADEHALLDGIATQQQIGRHTYSCCYIEPTEFGGIHIKTVNLNWVTCDMIRNALVTSGINNCNIICVAPIEVSGTGSLTGIFKAYDLLGQERVTEEKKAIASEELITTCEVAQEIGQEEATNMLIDLKEEVIEGDIGSEEDVLDLVERYVDKYNIKLTEERKIKLVHLLFKMAGEDYSLEEIKEAYSDIKETTENIKKTTEKTMNFFEKIVNFFKELWQKITGKYDEVKQSEAYERASEQLGILMNTNDDLLGDKTVVTDTDKEVIEEIRVENNQFNSEDNQTKDEEKHWYDFIVKIFKSGSKVKTEPKTETEINEESSTEAIIKGFGEIEDTEVEDESWEVETYDEIETEENKLDYVTYDFEEQMKRSEEEREGQEGQEVKPSGNISFDELTQD